MYTVDRIEDSIVILEDRKNSKVIEINKKELPTIIKEGDILYIENNKYILDKATTNRVNKNIQDRFNRLKKN